MKLFPAKTMLLITALLCCRAAFCQKKTSPEDTVTIRHSLNTATLLFKKSLYDSATKVCNNVLRQTEKNHLKVYAATAWDIMAEIMLANGKMAAMKKYDSLILPIAIQLRDTTPLINARNRVGLYLLDQGKLNNDLQLKVADDGCGFDAAKQTSSSGLKNMQARAASLNGTLNIFSRPGKVTAITLRIPTT
jgi:hypothetical protein